MNTASSLDVGVKFKLPSEVSRVLLSNFDIGEVNIHKDIPWHALLRIYTNENHTACLVKVSQTSQ